MAKGLQTHSPKAANHCQRKIREDLSKWEAILLMDKKTEC